MDLANAFDAARKIPRAAWIGAGIVAAVVAGVWWALSSAKEAGRAEARAESKLEKVETKAAINGAAAETAKGVASVTSDVAGKRREIDRETADAIESIRIAVGAETLVSPDLSRRGVCAIVRLRAQAGEYAGPQRACDQPDKRFAEPLRPQG